LGRRLDLALLLQAMGRGVDGPQRDAQGLGNVGRLQLLLSEVNEAGLLVECHGIGSTSEGLRAHVQD
jgi:hypothetical protein